MKWVILGLSITSSWGNGHATIYRGLVRELVRRGHDVLFLEHDKPWYAANRDLPAPPDGRTVLYGSLAELKARYVAEIRSADAVMVGSYVPEGIEVGWWVTSLAPGITMFYDIDTPVTLAGLERGRVEYLSRELIPRYSLYLSFTGGPTLQRLEEEFGSPCARPFYCCVDPAVHFPEPTKVEFDLGLMGTFSPDRLPALERLLLVPAAKCPEGRFVVAGPLYPQGLRWPANVRRIEHLPPARHRWFYNAQRFTLNITRGEMARAGYSPSVRLFEASACGVPIITDRWAGLEEFFEPGREILPAESAADVLGILREIDPTEAAEIGQRARARVLAEHTAAHRAAQLEQWCGAAVTRSG